MKLWDYFNGEPYLVNPHIIALNPGSKSKIKRSKKMAAAKRKRNKKGQFVKARSTARRNPPSTTAKRKSPARRNVPAKTKRRSVARRQSGKILGMGLKEVFAAGAGFVIPPYVEGVVKPFLPATFTANVFGKYGLKVGSVVAVSFLGGKFLGREVGKYLAIGGVTYVIANLIVDYVPQIFSGFGSYINPGRVLPAAPRQKQVGNGMGEYRKYGALRAVGQTRSKVYQPKY